MDQIMENKTILFVDGFVYDIPLPYKTAKECGLNTVGLGPNPDPGFKYIDHYYQCSAWDEDEKIFDMVDEITGNHTIDGIMTFDEVNVQITAKIGEKLDLPGNSVRAANNARNKYLMRKAFAQHQVPSPGFKLVRRRSDLEDIGMDFPLIIKPVAGSGSLGVCRVDNYDELAAHYDQVREIIGSQATRKGDENETGALLVEEYVDGEEVCMEALTYKGNTEVLVIQDEPYKNGPYFAESAFITPSQFPAAVQEKIVETARKAVKAIGITSGPSHVEMTITKDMEPVVIEVGARVGGYGLFHNAVFYSRGINYIREIYKTRLNIKPNLEGKDNFVVGNIFLRADVSRPGTITSISGIDEIKKIKEVQFVILVAKPGDPVTPLPHGRAGGACGSVFIKTNTHDENKAIRDQVNRLFKVEVSSSQVCSSTSNSTLLKSIF